MGVLRFAALPSHEPRASPKRSRPAGPTQPRGGSALQTGAEQLQTGAGSGAAPGGPPRAAQRGVRGCASTWAGGTGGWGEAPRSPGCQERPRRSQKFCPFLFSCFLWLPYLVKMKHVRQRFVLGTPCCWSVPIIDPPKTSVISRNAHEGIFCGLIWVLP